MIEQLTKADRTYNKKYKRHGIDESIVKFLQSRDKWNFGSEDKIFFFKELSYMLKWWVWIIAAVNTTNDNLTIQAIISPIIATKK